MAVDRLSTLNTWEIPSKMLLSQMRLIGIPEGVC